MGGFSVVILSKTDANLDPCVDAIRAAGETCRVIVVDDGLQFERDDCEYLDGRKPFIFARNANLGIYHAGEDVILCNDDALLQTPGGFSLLAKAGRRHPEYGLIGAVTNVTGQSLQRPQGLGLRQVPHIAFVCVLIPWSTIQLVGALDERYCLDYGVEDRDLCESVNRAGLKVGVHDDCFVDHGSLTSSFRGDPLTPKSYTQNFELFRQKWGIS